MHFNIFHFYLVPFAFVSWKKKIDLKLNKQMDSILSAFQSNKSMEKPKKKGIYYLILFIFLFFIKIERSQ